jgi:hypothetical protein
LRSGISAWAFRARGASSASRSGRTHLSRASCACASDYALNARGAGSPCRTGRAGRTKALYADGARIALRTCRTGSTCRPGTTDYPLTFSSCCSNCAWCARWTARADCTGGSGQRHAGWPGRTGRALRACRTGVASRARRTDVAHARGRMRGGRCATPCGEQRSSHRERNTSFQHCCVHKKILSIASTART